MLEIQSNTHPEQHLTPGPSLSRRALGKGSAAVALGALAAGAHLRGVSARQATPVAPADPSWQAVDDTFAVAAPEATMLAAELIDGRVIPIHGVNSDVVQPVGSSFKLWILGALANEVAAGNITWDQTIEFQELYRSVPGGDLRFALPGSSYTVRYFAERMMQKSDNTATDHMFHLVGREQVETAMIEMGHTNPEINIPIISTRELALLKFGYTTEELDEIYGLSPDDRRRFLDEDLANVGIDTLADTDQAAPLEIDRVEWFASREDLANTMNWIDLKAMEPGMLPLREIIALETQLTFDGSIWPYAGFKGGSELGVLSGTWLLHRADGRHFVLSTGFKNPDGPIDMAAAVAAMEASRDQFALTP